MIPVPPENQLINANYGQPVSNTRMLKVDDEGTVWPPRVEERRTYYASHLWDLGAGYVRTTELLPLDQIWI
jgi:hypothetical protein